MSTAKSFNVLLLYENMPLSLTVAQGLKDKGCDVKVVDSAANLIKTMVTKEHDVIGISVNHASCNSLIKIIDQKTNIPILVYGEDRRDPTMKKIQIANAPYKVNGVLTAYNAWMKIHNQFKEKMKEDYSTPDSLKNKNEESANKESSASQGPIHVKGSGKINYTKKDSDQKKRGASYHHSKGKKAGDTQFAYQPKPKEGHGAATQSGAEKTDANGIVHTSGKKLKDLGTVTNAQKKAMEEEAKQQAAAGTKPKFNRGSGRKKKGSRLFNKANRQEQNKTSTRKADESDADQVQNTNPIREGAVERDDNGQKNNSPKMSNTNENKDPGSVHNLTKESGKGNDLQANSKEENAPGTVDAIATQNKSTEHTYEENQNPNKAGVSSQKSQNKENHQQSKAKESEQAAGGGTKKETAKEREQAASTAMQKETEDGAVAKPDKKESTGAGVNAKKQEDKSKIINVEKELQKKKKNPKFAKEFEQVVKTASGITFKENTDQQTATGKVKQVSVVPVENNGDVGYLLFCSEKNGTVSEKEIEELKSQLKTSENTEIVGNLKVGDIFTVDIVETDMFDWAKNFSQFHVVVKSEEEENNGNVVICFITREQVYPNLSKEEALNLYKIELNEVPAMLPVNFSAFLYLRKNERVLPYLNKGGYLSEEQIDRLTSYGFDSLFIKEEDIQAYYNFFVSKSVNQDISPSEKIKAKIAQKVEKTATEDIDQESESKAA